MDHVPQHCQELAEQIATETDEAKREVLRAKFRDDCQDDGMSVMSATAGDDDSGGGGNTNPTQPGPKKPPVVE